MFTQSPATVYLSVLQYLLNLHSFKILISTQSVCELQGLKGNDQLSKRIPLLFLASKKRDMGFVKVLCPLLYIWGLVHGSYCCFKCWYHGRTGLAGFWHQAWDTWWAHATALATVPDMILCLHCDVKMTSKSLVTPLSQGPWCSSRANIKFLTRNWSSEK